MKKLTCLLFALLILSGLAACAPPRESGGETPPNGSGGGGGQSALFAGKIMQLLDGSVLLAGAAADAGAGELYLLSLANLAITDAQNTAADAGALKEGMLVTVAYSGAVMESFPMQFAEPAALHVTGEAEPLAGFYLSVIRDLFGVDPGLNDGIAMLAFDLEEAENLTASEKGALLYMAQNEFSLDTLAAGFDELCEEGLIDREKAYFEKGLLFNFSEMEFSGDTFTFSVSKWRSGLGAYFFADCVAEKKDGGWTYTVGSEMIS